MRLCFSFIINTVNAVQVINLQRWNRTPTNTNIYDGPGLESHGWPRVKWCPDVIMSWMFFRLRYPGKVRVFANFSCSFPSWKTGRKMAPFMRSQLLSISYQPFFPLQLSPFGWRIDHRLLRVHYFRCSPGKELLVYDYKFSRTNEKTNRSFTDKLKTPAIEKGIGLQLASLKPFSLSDERPVIPRTTSRYFSFRSFSNKWSS